MPVSWLPTTIPVPVKPRFQRSGAFTKVTFGSMVSGLFEAFACKVATESKSVAEASVELSQFDESLASITLTSDLAARLSTSARPPEWTTSSFATQNERYETPCWSSMALSGPCVVSAVCLSVR